MRGLLDVCPSSRRHQIKLDPLQYERYPYNIPPQNNQTRGFLNFPTFVFRNPLGDYPPCGRIRRGFLPAEIFQFPKLRTARYSLDTALYTLECRCGAVALFLIQKNFRPSLGLTSRSPCFVHLNELNREAALLFDTLECDSRLPTCNQPM